MTATPKKFDAETIVEEVKRAYETCGLKPVSRGFFSEDGTCCCPMSALALQASVKLPERGKNRWKFDAGNIVAEWAKETFGKKWAQDFWESVDGAPWPPREPDARRAGEAVKEALGL